MINPIRINIKGFPRNSQIEQEQFYNENDLMSPIKITIGDFPIFLSENFEMILTKFKCYSKAKLKINVKPSSCIKFKMPRFNAVCSAIIKVKIKPNIKIGFKQYLNTRIRMFGFTNFKLKHNSFVKSKIIQKGIVTSKNKVNIFRIIPEKCYSVITDKTLGFWDDYLLTEIDDLDNFSLGGTILD